MDTGSSALVIVSVSLLVTEEEKQSLGESLTGLKLSAASKSRVGKFSDGFQIGQRDVCTSTDVILFGRNSQTGKSSAHQSPAQPRAVEPSSSRIPKQSYAFSLNKARSYATILFVYSFSARSCLVDKSFVFERSVFTAL